MKPNDTDSGKSTGCIDHTDPETLRELYWAKELTLAEIGELAGKSAGAIHHQMSKHGIETAGRGERNKVPYANFYTQQNGYEVWDCESGTLPVHRLLAVSEYGFEAVDGDVHHDIPIPWLNTPDNITPMSRTEHIREHSEFDVEDIREMRRMSEDGMYDREIAELFDTSRSTVNSITSGAVWKDV